jgi:hypothetical protein
MIQFLMALVVVASTAIPAFTSGYTDYGSDPDDRRPVGFDPDIRATARKVWAAPNGHRYLTMSFWTYEHLGLYWVVLVKIDSRGGPLADHRLEMYNADQSGKGCSMWKAGASSSTARRGAFRQSGRLATCRIPLPSVQPNKRIRWKLISTSGYVKDNVEYAPNSRGWYR